MRSLLGLAASMLTGIAIYGLIGLYGGAVLVLASASGPDAWFERRP